VKEPIQSPLVWLAMLATYSTVLGDEVRIHFDLLPFDRGLLRTETGESGGRWEMTSAGFRAILPAGTLGRPPLKILAQVHLKDDFEITTQYKIASLPHPTAKSGSNNVEIAISGSDGFVSCFRNNEAGARGDGYGFYVDYSDQRGSLFRHFPTTATRGLLGLKRIGKTLHFSSGEVGGELAELGSCEFGRAPITEVVFQALANGTTDGLDVWFERVEVRANKIVRLHRPPSEGFRWWVWGIVAGVAIIVVVWAGRRWVVNR